MAFEVELKAHIDNPQHLRTLISKLLGVMREEAFEKTDTYWSDGKNSPIFRMREERCCGRNTLMLTRKIKEVLSNGIEINNELEIPLSSDYFSEMNVFFSSLGYVEAIKKKKVGWSYYYSGSLNTLQIPVHIELVEVLTLGWFLEIEILLQDENGPVEEAQNILFSLLDALSVSRLAIENRYYLDLLKR